MLVLLSLPLIVQAQTTGNCSISLGEAFLDINDVRARIFNNGGLFWRGDPHVYEVPKGGREHAIFGSGIWVAGMADDVLRIAAARYGPWEFWSGPLDENGDAPEDCSLYDQVYKVSIHDLIAYDQSGFLPSDLENWPWELGAPVVDGDGNPDNYDITTGDRPELAGQQAIWWIMNDLGNLHEATNGNPLGIEIRATAFASASDVESINNATLYKYLLTYRGNAPLEDAYFTVFVDPDLGNFDDDYIGSDSTLHLGYVYNADNEDEGPFGYGSAPPALGYQILKGPLAEQDGEDNDRDGAIDEDGERIGLSSFIYFNNGTDEKGDPVSDAQYYNYMQGVWRDGQPLTLWEDGRNASNASTSFAYSGDPVSGEGWTEFSPSEDGSLPANVKGDRRMLLNMGPFTMQPGQTEEFVFSIVWGRGTDNINSIDVLKAAAAEVKEAYEAGFNIPIPPEPELEPLQVITLSAPDDQANNQPLNPTLHWVKHPDIEPIEPFTSTSASYKIEISTDDTFVDAESYIAPVSNTISLDNLSANTTYFWRVRAAYDTEVGPWSDVWQFTTGANQIESDFVTLEGFMATHNAAGPIEPPDMAALASNNSGFPILEGNLTPIGSYPDAERPTVGVQQATNDYVWAFHTGGAGRSRFNNDQGQSFIERSIRNGFEVLGTDDYEQRFTQRCLDAIDGDITEADCLAWREFSDDALVEVPFELWNVGDPEESGDDFRLVPIICESPCQAGTDQFTYDIANDHDISEGSDDPYTDWVYWYNPEDNGNTPGEQGYLDYFFGNASIGEEVMARTVLVLLNGGEAPPYPVQYPEVGTVFRIVTGRIPPPLLAAPANASLVDTSTTVALYWHGPEAIYQVQIDSSSDFLNPIIDENGISGYTYSAANLSYDNTFFWRTRVVSETGALRSDWSETWSFTIPLNVSVENESAFPAAFTLAPNYPNPFSQATTIRYGLPESSSVKIALFDALGRRLHVLEEGNKAAGWHEVLFNADKLPNGIYFYRMQVGSFIKTRMMSVVK